jgi:hypothetical protein
MKAAARERRSVADHVEHSFEMEAHNLQALRSQVDANQVIRLAKRLNRAGRIMVVGVDFAASLSYLLAYGLKWMRLSYRVKKPKCKSRLVARNIGLSVDLCGPQNGLYPNPACSDARMARPCR